MLAIAARSISREVALHAFEGVVRAWKLPKASDHRLLSQSERTLYNWFASLNDPQHATKPLPADVLERISHIVSIYDGLHSLFGEPSLADAWVGRPNAAFAEQRPIDMLLTGRFAPLIEIRHYIDRALTR